jgi:uncharacterized protein (DUF697 family)/tellurite resistance protein
MSVPNQADDRTALVAVCVLAAFADGAQDEQERAHVRRVVSTLPGAGEVDLPAVIQGVLTKHIGVSDIAAALDSAESRALAYELAVAVCDADGSSNDREKAFLASLRDALKLDKARADAFVAQADQMVDLGLPAPGAPLPPPLPVPVAAARPGVNQAEIDEMILNASILNGALELLPQTLASMGILPLQMRLVYRIGTRYGYSLDSGHIKDLLATVGVGAASQVVEGYTRRILGGLAGRLGGLIGGAAKTAVNWGAGPLMTFATTYALGKVAQQYYAGGRKLSTVDLKSVFTKESEQAKVLYDKYKGRVENEAGRIDLAKIPQMLRAG